jgi:hypothetical protein
LWAIPSDFPYPEWFKVLCAAKAEGLSIDDVDSWSSTGSNYKGRHDVERTFRNIKMDGGIGPGTLFYLAKQYGWEETANLNPERPLAVPVTRRFLKKEAAPNSSEILEDITACCEPATASHSYIQKKLGLPDSLLVYRGNKTVAGFNCNGALVLPLSDLDGTLVGVQFIPLKGEKVYPLGTKLPPEACLVIGGELADGGTVYIVEGIGQAWTAQQATKLPAVACCGKARMKGVAEAIHAKFPNLLLVIVPDAEKPHARR